MISAGTIKETLSPTQVARHYLGLPLRTKGQGLWYKSPFRPEERTASFLVTDQRGFHDFGTSEHFDIISFIERFYNTDFKNSISILASDFGIQDENELSDEVKQYLIQKRKQEKEIENKINTWYNKTLQKICDEIRENERLIPYVKGEALKIVYDRQSVLEIYFEILYPARTFKDKYNLWNFVDKQFL